MKNSAAGGLALRYAPVPVSSRCPCRARGVVSGPVCLSWRSSCGPFGSTPRRTSFRCSWRSSWWSSCVRVAAVALPVSFSTVRSGFSPCSGCLRRWFPARFIPHRSSASSPPPRLGSPSPSGLRLHTRSGLRPVREAHPGAFSLWVRLASGALSVVAWWPASGSDDRFVDGPSAARRRCGARHGLSQAGQPAAVTCDQRHWRSRSTKW